MLKKALCNSCRNDERTVMNWGTGDFKENRWDHSNLQTDNLLWDMRDTSRVTPQNFLRIKKCFEKNWGGGGGMCVLCTTYRSFLARVTLFATAEQLQFLAAPFLKSETKTKLIHTCSRQLEGGAERTESLDSATEGTQHIFYAILVFAVYCLFL